MMFSLSLSAFAYADAGPDAGNSSGNLTPEEAAKLREQVNQLSQLLGNPAPPAPIVPGAVVEHKTPADVADKALSMFSGMMGSLSATLQKVAPEIWRIMIRQQYAKAIGNVIFPLGLLFISGLYMVATRVWWSKERQIQSDDDAKGFMFVVGSLLPTIACLIFGIWFSSALSDSSKFLINPEFYAVKDMLLLVTNPTAAGQ